MTGTVAADGDRARRCPRRRPRCRTRAALARAGRRAGAAAIDDDVTRNALARVSGELAAAPFKTITGADRPRQRRHGAGRNRGQRTGRRPPRSRSCATAIRAPGASRSGSRTASAAPRPCSACRSRAATSTGRPRGWPSRRSSSCAPAWRGCGRRRPVTRAARDRREAVRRAPGAARAGGGVGLVTISATRLDFWAPQIAASYRPARQPSACGCRRAGWARAPTCRTDDGQRAHRARRCDARPGGLFRPDRVVQPMIGLGPASTTCPGHGTARPRRRRTPTIATRFRAGLRRAWAWRCAQPARRDRRRGGRCW